MQTQSSVKTPEEISLEQSGDIRALQRYRYMKWFQDFPSDGFAVIYKLLWVENALLENVQREEALRLRMKKITNEQTEHPQDIIGFTSYSRTDDIKGLQEKNGTGGLSGLYFPTGRYLEGSSYGALIQNGICTVLFATDALEAEDAAQEAVGAALIVTIHPNECLLLGIAL
ncbi:hypothetical protein N7471_002846 [Penicillium samsonianum]|uniref:uncharacterized protein n=1 Tax=Penicillium samsonianum TaxID=1882272 RepID=UPI00254684A6|nr:uncharacterized protein N7471_002846 [Penicillium samsonianum]KAJ6143393.1 hypothetical protein N7471_002846 [Penicillium samsonianum]